MTDEDYSWVPTNSEDCVKHEQNAVLAGYEAHDNSSIYVGRVHYKGEIIPCKVIPRYKVAYMAHNNREKEVKEFEMYCRTKPTIKWLPGSNGYFPPGSIPAGRALDGETLYVGRTHHLGALTVGKVQPSHRCCYISHGGKQISYKLYEVMVRSEPISYSDDRANKSKSAPECSSTENAKLFPKMRVDSLSSNHSC